MHKAGKTWNTPKALFRYNRKHIPCGCQIVSCSLTPAHLSGACLVQRPERKKDTNLEHWQYLIGCGHFCVFLQRSLSKPGPNKSHSSRPNAHSPDLRILAASQPKKLVRKQFSGGLTRHHRRARVHSPPRERWHKHEQRGNHARPTVHGRKACGGVHRPISFPAHNPEQWSSWGVGPIQRLQIDWPPRLRASGLGAARLSPRARELDLDVLSPQFHAVERLQRESRRANVEELDELVLPLGRGLAQLLDVA